MADEPFDERVFLLYTTETEGGKWIYCDDFKTLESAKQQAGMLIASGAAYSARVLEERYYESRQSSHA